jgi:hypothetical protein
MANSKFKIRGIDQLGKVSIKETDLRDVAFAMAEQFRRDGYTSVEVIE